MQDFIVYDIPRTNILAYYSYNYLGMKNKVIICHVDQITPKS